MTVSQKLVLSFQALIGSTIIDLAWYVFEALGVWLFFYVIFRHAMRHRRVARFEPESGQIRREILHSLRSLAIFGLVGGLIVYAYLSGWTRLYLRIEQYGWTWFFISIGVMVIVHDTYFYWSHRAMHHPWLYKRLHHTHHLSISPTPWAAYAFSPGEALIQSGIGPLIIFTIPVHPLAFGVFMSWQIGFNVFGHCGYEIFPQWFLKTRVLKFLNSITHHALHHEKFRANYSLYFNVWDRIMGTNHADYEPRFFLATTVPPPESCQSTEPILDPVTTPRSV